MVHVEETTAHRRYAGFFIRLVVFLTQGGNPKNSDICNSKECRTRTKSFQYHPLLSVTISSSITSSSTHSTPTEWCSTTRYYWSQTCVATKAAGTDSGLVNPSTFLYKNTNACLYLLSKPPLADIHRVLVLGRCSV